MQKTKRRRKKAVRVKICVFCEERVNYIDFKQVEVLKRFQTEQGKILPPRITGTCPKHQKMLATAVKRARNLALTL
ncbi:MAG: 30S ribosomal protein S18 [Lentisphaeria bacterium]